MTAIEWVINPDGSRGRSWNPIVGCSVVSPACRDCYAMAQAARLLDRPGSHYAGTTKRVKGNAVWTGKIAVAPLHILLAPLMRRTPTTWFVNSMGDVFHEGIPDEDLHIVHAVMALCPQHRFLSLTKRSDRQGRYLAQYDTALDGEMRRVWGVEPTSHINALEWGFELMRGLGWKAARPREWPGWPLPNVGYGVSVENLDHDSRIVDLQHTPSAMRWLSLEPLLGELDLTNVRAGVHDRFEDCGGCPDDFFPKGSVGWGRSDVLRGEYWGTMQSPDGKVWRDHEQLGFTEPPIDWVVVGGESGPRARPMHPDWARSIRHQCRAAGVPFFFKQWGAWASPNQIPGACGCKLGSKRPFVGKILGPRVGEYLFGGRVFRSYVHDDGQIAVRVGKARAGRELDGRTWNQLPAFLASAAAAAGGDRHDDIPF